MLNISYGQIQDSRNWIISNVTQWKIMNPKLKVIDIGGNAIGWTKDIVDMVVDINSPENENSNKIGICNLLEWNKLLEHVLKQGKYDYAICTHTLEDIYNPIVAIELLPKIAHAGIITMPSIRTELSRIESLNWIGYIHHRWIFDQMKGEMLVIPKICLLEGLVGNTIKHKFETDEIRFQWSDEIPYKIFMNNYLGPNADTVITEYKNLIKLLQ
jgi:hypothetical protein